MNKKIFFTFLTLSFLLAGVFLFMGVVYSADTPPEKNPICWLQKDCEAQRGNKGAFVLDEETCPGYAQDNENNDKYKWGKCLAGSATASQISFGGKSEFINIGDYIKTIYNYSLIILGILASVMIIVAGIQYVGSAGNPEMISSAKKRILGALIGLALAYMSYTVLNIVNPNTINLRLPQVYLIREVPLNFETFLSCNPKESNSDIKCQEHYNNKMAYCQPLGADGLEGGCAKIVRGSIQLAANIAILSTPIGGGSIVGNLILSGGKILKLAKIGGYLYAQDKFFEPNPIGVCVLGNSSAVAGSFCDPDGKKSKCASGLSCLEIPAVQGLNCWTGNRIGICSSGKLNAVCNTDNDCVACKEASDTCTCRPVTSNLSACTDGSQGSSCLDDGQCNNPLKCVKVSPTIGFCGTGDTKSGGLCNNKTDCEQQGWSTNCYTYKEGGIGCGYINIENLNEFITEGNYKNYWLYAGSAQAEKYGVCGETSELNNIFIQNDLRAVFQRNDNTYFYCKGSTLIDSSPF